MINVYPSMHVYFNYQDIKFMHFYNHNCIFLTQLIIFIGSVHAKKLAYTVDKAHLYSYHLLYFTTNDKIYQNIPPNLKNTIMNS